MDKILPMISKLRKEMTPISFLFQTQVLFGSLVRRVYHGPLCLLRLLTPVINIYTDGFQMDKLTSATIALTVMYKMA